MEYDERTKIVIGTEVRGAGTFYKLYATNFFEKERTCPTSSNSFVVSVRGCNIDSVIGFMCLFVAGTRGRPNSCKNRYRD